MRLNPTSRWRAKAAGSIGFASVPREASVFLSAPDITQLPLEAALIDRDGAVLAHIRPI
jgi:hypothetical protein